MKFLELFESLLWKGLHGGCYQIALALHHALKLPLYGMFDSKNGDLHHAFVFDEKTNTAYDVRGGMPLDRIPTGSSVKNPTFAPVTDYIVKEAARLYGRFVSRAEVQQVVQTCLRQRQD